MKLGLSSQFTHKYPQVIVKLPRIKTCLPCFFRMTSLPSRTIAPADSAIIEHITSCTMCRTLVNAHSVEKELRKTDIALNAEMQQWKANRAAAELAARDAHIKALQEQLHLLDPTTCPCAKPYFM